MKPISRYQQIKLGTEINLPCLLMKIARVMEIIKNITEEETSGRLNKSEDPNDPYNVDETQARTCHYLKAFGMSSLEGMVRSYQERDERF